VRSTNNEAPVERDHKVEQKASNKKLQPEGRYREWTENEIKEIIQITTP
jgi:hypothetical protein